MEKFFDSLSNETQLILSITIIAILMFAVFSNNKRNRSKLRGRKDRRFKDNYNKKKRG